MRHTSQSGLRRRLAAGPVWAAWLARARLRASSSRTTLRSCTC